jgi:hypothetical protein
VIFEVAGTTIASALGAGGLGEDRRGFADGAEIDAADVQAFEQHRARRKFRPFHFDTLGRQPFFQRAASLEQDQRAVFLVADPQHARCLRARRARRLRQRRQAGGKRAGAGDAGAENAQETAPVLAGALLVRRLRRDGGRRKCHGKTPVARLIESEQKTKTDYQKQDNRELPEPGRRTLETPDERSPCG